MLALAAALAAACFVRAFGIAFLGRPRSAEAAEARRGRSLLARRDGRARGSVPVRRPVPRLGDRRARAGRCAADRRPACRRRRACPGCPSRRSRTSRSSYNGLLVFLFIAVSASLAAVVIHRLASKAVRRAPAWDCGFPDADPATQYSAESFTQPIRRVFGGFVFPRAKPSTCRRPATPGRRGSTVTCATPSGRRSACRSPRV